MPVLSVKNVAKRFSGFQALKDIGFELDEGDTLIVLGPNGAGKSTLLKTIAGLYRPSAGTIKIFDTYSEKLDKEMRKRISFLGESYALYDDLTCRENIGFFSRLYNIENHERKLRRLLSDFDALQFIEKKVGTLSRGTKQKIALCRALINEPRLLILDEPAAFLDSSASEGLHRILNGLSKEHVTVLYATQRLEELYRIGKKMLLLDHGVVLRFGDIADVIDELEEIEVEVTLSERLRDRKMLKGYAPRFVSENVLIARVGKISEVPRLVNDISRAGGLIINVNSLKQNINDIIKRGASG